MRNRAQLLAVLLICVLLQPASRGIASPGFQQGERVQEQAKQKELRLKAREYFEGRDEWTAPPVSHEEHFERLVKLTDAVIQTVKDYPGLDMNVPAFAQKQKPGTARDYYYYIALFGQECPPSGQPNNYYANLTRASDPQDPGKMSYQERFQNFIMTDPRERLEPADVMRYALDAAHGNYRLAMLTAHNFLKEIAYVGREEIKDINDIKKPPDKNRWPAEWVGVSPWLGDVARRLRGLRDSRVADKMGAWYHLFVPLAGEAWGSVEAAERMTAAEHFGRKWGIFNNPDPEKREIDLIAIHMMKEIREVRAAAEGGTEIPGASASRPIQGPSGKLVVTVTDPLFPEVPSIVSLRASTGVEPHKSIVSFMSGNEIALPTGIYLVEVDKLTTYTAGPREVKIEAGKTATLTIALKPDYSYINVMLTDAKTGQGLEGIDVAISGPRSEGPEPSPASFYAVPGTYRVIVPKSEMNGVRYQAKDATVEVAAGRRAQVAIALERLPESSVPASIRISPGALDLNVGDRYEMTAEVEDQDGAGIPGARVTWSSSAPAVARIDASGEVSGVSGGKAEIEAACGGARASMIVTVTTTIQLQSCRIVNNPRSLPARGGSYLLKGEAYDTEGKRIEKGIHFAWESLNTGVASVDKETGRISTKTPGKFTVALVVAAEDGTEASVMEDIVVENSWVDVLAYGRVLKADGSPAAGATVASNSGPVVMSDGAGEFTALVGGGPHPEGSNIEVEASLDGASGRASGTIRDGFARDVTIILKETGSRTGQPQPGAMTDGERQALLNAIKDWQKALDCLLEGKRKYPNYWQDCNGNWTMRSRDLEIANLQKLIRDAQIKLGLPVTVAGETASNTPGLRSTSASTQAAIDFLAFMEFYGPSLWYTPPAGQETRLEQGSSPPPGSALRTGQGSRVTVRVNKSTTASIAENTRVTLPKPETGGVRKTFSIQSGRVDFSRPEGAPSFDDVVVTSPHGSMSPLGTIYRVEVDETETRLTVFEGTVQASGAYILREYGPGVESGKPSPSRELKVGAGERVRLIGFGANPATSGQVPQWAKGKEPAPDQGQAAPQGEKPAGQAGSALPSWAKPQSTGQSEGRPPGSPNAAAVSPLDLPDPWNQPVIQQLMDVWVNTAIPPSNTPGVVMRYNEWAQPLSQAARATANPEHPPDWSRYRYLWENRWRYDSTNLCKMGVFIEKSVKGESLADCGTGGAGRAAGPTSGTAGRREQPASTRPPLPGLLAALGEIEDGDWINGRPDLRGREVMLFLFPGCAGTDSLPQQAYMCLQQAQNCAAKIASHGSVFVMLAGGQCQDGRDPVEAWRAILQSFRFTFPTAVDRDGEAIRALMKLGGEAPSTGMGYVGLVFSPDGRILRRGPCHALFQGLIENKKG